MEFLDLKSKLDAEDVTLVAVSKTKPVSAILELYHQGQRVFGENRVQELASKYESLPKDIEWHMIGHLQKNKVKYIAPFVSMIHSVGSVSLLEEINKRAKQNERVIDILLQFKIATEETKYGSSGHEDWADFPFDKYENVRFRGVMGMATFTDNTDQVRSEFRRLKNIFDNLKTSIFATKDEFQVISMGMSGDYVVAIEEGSNMVRIGSLLFGARR